MKSELCTCKEFSLKCFIERRKEAPRNINLGSRNIRNIHMHAIIANVFTNVNFTANCYNFYTDDKTKIRDSLFIIQLNNYN